MAASACISDFTTRHLVAQKQSFHYYSSRFCGESQRSSRVILKHKFLLSSGDVRLSCFQRRKPRYLKRGGVLFARAKLQGENSDFGFVLDGVPHLSDWLPNLTIVVQMNSPRGIHFRRAGPREKVCFKADEVRACIVTCGGLCPGLNTVVREIVCGLQNMYGVNDVLGIVGGYKGFYSHNTIPLNPKVVNDIHKRGGTILGTSRGGYVTSKIVDSIQDRGINQVYILGGDGSQRGATVIYEVLTCFPDIEFDPKDKM